MHIIKYNRYPNNEVRLTHYYKAERTIVNPAIENCSGGFSCPGTASGSDDEGESASNPPLDISSKVSASEENMPHRRTEFGLSAKRTILRLGGAYDTVDAEPSHYIFLTGTLPGGTHESKMAIARESRYIVKSVAEWLKRECPTEHWFYVWELQRRGALHIHYCLYAPNPSLRANILQGWWGKWHSIIQGVGSRTNTDMWLRADGSHHKEGHSVLQAYAQEVRKSVAAYMAGYCAGAKDKHSMDKNTPYYPGRWWGYSRASSKLLKGLTEEVAVEYSSYVEANSQMRQAKEAILHDTPHVHAYPHKVGIGSTIVSYHPEDKGQSIWNQLTMSIHNPTTFPNASSWIAALERYIRIWVVYYKALKKPREIASLNLLQDCEDILSQGSLSRYTLHQSTLRTVRRLTSELSLTTLLASSQELTMSECVPPIWMLSRVEQSLRWNAHGWLSLESDFDIRLTDCWSLRHNSTTDSDEPDAVPTDEVYGLPSPHPLPQQLDLLCSSDSLEHSPKKSRTKPSKS